MAGNLVIRASACVSLFREAPQEAVFIAVEEGLDAVEPIVGRSAKLKELILTQRPADSDCFYFNWKEENQTGFGNK